VEHAATWDPRAGVLRVEGRLARGGLGPLAVESGAERFVTALEASADRDGASWTPSTRDGRLFVAAPCAAGPCRIRYRYALREAARAIDELDVASDEGAVVEAPPSTWLLAPTGADRDARLRFRVSCPAGSRFVTGAFASAEAAGAWDLSLDDFWSSPYSAFGPLRVHEVPVDGAGARVELAIGPGELAVPDATLVRWTERAGRAVAGYAGAFPMKSALVLVAVARGRWVGPGRTLGGGGATVFMRVGGSAAPSDYDADWVLVHEMLHLAFPSVAREHDWAEEGLSTYVEPLARARAGMLSESEAWRGLAAGLPQGLPGAGDRGLDLTPTWGRTYWGGALFWLLADVEIRKRSQGRLGLEDALRGIREAGGSNAVRWPLDGALAAGDRTIGFAVLQPLHDAMATEPHPVDLPALLASLGVATPASGAVLDDHAPLAGLRRAMTRGAERTERR